MRLGLKIAVRFLKSNKGQTILIILGIAIGVSVQIFIGSLIQGLQKGLIEKTIGSSSQITVTSDIDDKEITKYQDVIADIQSVSDSIYHISVASDHSAFLKFKDNSQSILVRGFELDKANGIYHLEDGMVEGTYPKNDLEIMLGIDFKQEYGIELNDEIEVLTPNNKSVPCKVVGFFDLKVASINQNWGITTLSSAQSIFETEDSVTSIEMQIKEADVFSADLIASDIVAFLKNDKLAVDNWKDQNEQLLSGLQGQSISSIMIQVFVLISVVLGIASVLAITVMQKSKQIGILKAMGIRNSLARWIFLFEGGILGLFGAVVGILFGLGLAFSFTMFALNADGTPVVELFISPNFIIASGLIAVVSSIIAALVPAAKSSKLNPIDIIRNQ